MSDALSLVEIEGQHVELLPARTVLSLFCGTTGTTGTTWTAGTTGTAGGAGSGTTTITENWIFVAGNQYNTLTGGTGGAGSPGGTGGAATGGAV
jgi:hypothetical protein